MVASSTGAGLAALAAAGAGASTSAIVSTAAVGGALVAAGSTVAASTAAAMGIAGIVAGVVGGAAAITTAGLAINDAVQGQDVAHKTSETFDLSQVYDYEGFYNIDHWNYKEDITTIFNPTDMTCEKCVVSTKCAKTKAPMFGDQYCLEWEKPSDKQCTTFEF